MIFSPVQKKDLAGSPETFFNVRLHGVTDRMCIVTDLRVYNVTKRDL